MTFFPMAWRRRANCSPMPDVAPMMRIVWMVLRTDIVEWLELDVYGT